MATKAPKKPKAIKYPKQPKATASPAIWKKYEERCKDVDKRNEAKLKPYNEKIKAIEKDNKDKKAIQARVSKLKGTR